jgi:hypothetical protein
MSDQASFKRALRALHAEKDAAYRDSWKRRGELISIMANIARKVDRLEYASAGALASHDESVLDTAVDLLVYSLKYQTYLADHDSSVATDLLADKATAPYSDGSYGFEALLDALDLSVLNDPIPLSLAEADRAAVAAFTRLEQCFPEARPPAAPSERYRQAGHVASAAAQVVAAIKREMPAAYRAFLAEWAGSDAP